MFIVKMDTKRKFFIATYYNFIYLIILCLDNQVDSVKSGRHESTSMDISYVVSRTPFVFNSGISQYIFQLSDTTIEHKYDNCSNRGVASGKTHG